jgi:hypothetical protein
MVKLLLGLTVRDFERKRQDIRIPNPHFDFHQVAFGSLKARFISHMRDNLLCATHNHV